MLATDRTAQRILWLDCVGGAAAGCTVMLLASWLSGIYQIPESLVIGNAVANLAYACFSFLLATWQGRPTWLVVLLAGANASWTAVCLVATFWFAGTASIFGLAHILFEGLYVAWLAHVEWSMRHRLGNRPGIR
jgi:hypothetical protein